MTLKHASVVLALISFVIGLTASAVTAYMSNKAHIEDLQQRVETLELRLDRLTDSRK